MSGGTPSNKSLYKDEMDPATTSLTYSATGTGPTLGSGRISCNDSNIIIPSESINYSAANDLSLTKNSSCFSNFNQHFIDLYNQPINPQLSSLNDASFYHANNNYFGCTANPQPTNYLENTLNESFSVDSTRDNELNNLIYENRPHGSIYGQTNTNQSGLYSQYVPNPSTNQKMASTPNKCNTQDSSKVESEIYLKPLSTKDDGSTQNSYVFQTTSNFDQKSHRGNSNELERSNMVGVFSPKSPAMGINSVGYNGNFKPSSYNQFNQFPLSQEQGKQSTCYSQFNPFYPRSNDPAIHMTPYIPANHDIYLKPPLNFSPMLSNNVNFTYPDKSTPMSGYGECGDYLGFAPQYYSAARPIINAPQPDPNNTTTIKPFSTNTFVVESPKIKYSSIGRHLLSKGEIGSKMISPKKKRLRMSYSRKQLSYLESEYQKNHFLQRERRLEISKHLNLSDRQIKIWFQNRRMKQKRNDLMSRSRDGSPKAEINCSSNFEQEFQKNVFENSLQNDDHSTYIDHNIDVVIPDNSNNLSHKEDSSNTTDMIDVTCSSSASVNSVSHPVDPISNDKKSPC